MKSTKGIKSLLVALLLVTFTSSCKADEKVQKETKKDNVTTNLANDKVEKEPTEKNRYSLAYMWHEEKLAYDIYVSLNKLYPTRQFENISDAENRHISMVESLVSSYDIDVTNIENLNGKYSIEVLKDMPIGEFKIKAIQDLYNILYEKGKKSKVDALQVGCMVEVTDIDDLDRFIIDANGNNNLISVYERLRAGSYNHYWAFDRGLKNEGVEDGCCSLGTIDGINYCKSSQEYPSKHGMRNGMGRGMRNGMGRGMRNGMGRGMRNGMGRGMRNGMGRGMRNGMGRGMRNNEDCIFYREEK